LAFGFTFGWPYIMSLGKEDMVLVDASRPEIQENRMVHPHYVSTDETDQPFQSKQQRVLQILQIHREL